MGAKQTKNNSVRASRQASDNIHEEKLIAVDSADATVVARAAEGSTAHDVRDVNAARDVNTNDLSLMTIDPATLPDVPYKGQQKHVYVYDVHDGDTVHFLMYIGGVPVKLALRLLGIDTPEIRGGQGHLTEEKTAGIMARDRLADLLGANVLDKNAARRPRKQTLTTIVIRDWDKFGGRVLGEIILPDGRSAAEILIAEGYGRRYNGEKKNPWTMEDLAAPPFKLL